MCRAYQPLLRRSCCGDRKVNLVITDEEWSSRGAYVKEVFSISIDCEFILNFHRQHLDPKRHRHLSCRMSQKFFSSALRCSLPLVLISTSDHSASEISTFHLGPELECVIFQLSPLCCPTIMPCHPALPSCPVVTPDLFQSSISSTSA